MKIKKVEALCKSDRRIILYEGDGVQWIGNGCAAYPLHNMPVLDETNVFTLFDVAEKDREKYYLRSEELPAALDFNDSSDTEVMLDRVPIDLYISGHGVASYVGSSGIIFVENRYLAPFTKQEGGFELYERFTKIGKPYIAVKSGLFLVGVIMLSNGIITSDFIENLEYIASLSRVTFNTTAEERERALAEKERALAAEEEPEDAMYHDSLLNMAKREPEETPEED